MNQSPLLLQGRLIAFFHQSADLYGSDRVLLDLVSGVQNAGGKSVVLLPNLGPLTEELAKREIEYHVLPVVKLTRARLNLKGLFGLLREAITSMRLYDGIFRGRQVHMVHSNTIAVLGGAVWAKRRRIPHLWHVHEIIINPNIAAKGFPRIVSALADHVVCNSHATYAWMASVCPSLKSRMSVIWNGVQAPDIVDAATVDLLRKKFHPAGARLAIGLLGRINRLKGHNLLLDAAESLHHQGVTNFSVVFIGSPPSGQESYLEQLRQRIARSPLRDRIVLQDFAANVWPAYAALDIICVPSTEPESFGLVAAEAMAAGKPVVASSIGALTEIVVDGLTGMTFHPVDSGELTKSLAQLLSNNEMRERFGREGAASARHKYSINKMVIDYVKSCSILIMTLQGSS